MVDPVSVATAAEVGKLVLLAKKEGWLKQLVTFFSQKNRVVILGNTGAGKTQFKESLTTLVPATIKAINRTEFATTDRLKIEDQIFDVIDTPGQTQHASKRTKAVIDAIRQDLHGVINVVSYGYDEASDSEERVFDDEGNLRPEYLANRRARELKSVEEWANLVVALDQRPWVVTVVSKADLWWDMRQDVMRYYTDGPYGVLLKSFDRNAGTVLAYSSVDHLFHGAVRSVGKFDQDTRNDLRTHLLKTIASAAK